MIYFTSDTHYGHKNIITYCNRPFETVGDMNETMLRNARSILTSEDTLVHLGDFTFINDVETNRNILQSIRAGKKYLVAGNHDRHKAHEFLAMGFDAVFNDQTFFTVQDARVSDVVESVTFWCAHIPPGPRADHRDYKRPESPFPFDIALCGHIHDRWKTIPHQALILPDFPQPIVNVGVDVWHFRPVSAQTIIAYVCERKRHGG